MQVNLNTVNPYFRSVQQSNRPSLPKQKAQDKTPTPKISGIEKFMYRYPKTAVITGLTILAGMLYGVANLLNYTNTINNGEITIDDIRVFNNDTMGQ